MSLSDFKMENPLGLPILPHLRRQISSRIGDYSGKTSSLYLRQAQQSLSLGYNKKKNLLFFYDGSPSGIESSYFFVDTHSKGTGDVNPSE